MIDILLFFSIITAYCRNPTDGMWYLFDDAHVSRVKESEIVTTSAYILFYQRRSLSMSSGSSEASSSSSSGSEHWAFRLPRGEARTQHSASNSRLYVTKQFFYKLAADQVVLLANAGGVLPIILVVKIDCIQHFQLTVLAEE